MSENVKIFIFVMTVHESPKKGFIGGKTKDDSHTVSESSSGFD
jgi:hypothetical protein